MKAILILDYIDEEDIEELRADVILDLYGDSYGFYKNMTLKPMPKKKDIYENIPVAIFVKGEQVDAYSIGWNDCIDAILGDEHE